MQGWNRKFKTRHRSVQQFLRIEYRRNPYIEKLAEVLGINHETLRQKLIKEKIPTLRSCDRNKAKNCPWFTKLQMWNQIHDTSYRTVRAWLKMEREKACSISNLAKRLEISYSSAYYVLIKEGLI